MYFLPILLIQILLSSWLANAFGFEKTASDVHLENYGNRKHLRGYIHSGHYKDSDNVIIAQIVPNCLVQKQKLCQVSDSLKNITMKIKKVCNLNKKFYSVYIMYFNFSWMTFLLFSLIITARIKIWRIC